MRALSLWQPWASLWCSKRKVHETRQWRCSHRGWLLIHAAKRFEKDLDEPSNNDDRECGDFLAGRFAWKRAEFQLFERPIPYRGAQGIFSVPDDLIP
jgi:hypothetical protein